VRRISPKKLIWVAVAIMAISPILRLSCHVFGDRFPTLRTGCTYYTWNAADGLALGALMALLLREWGNDRVRLRRFCVLLFTSGTCIALLGLPYGILTKMSTTGQALQWVPWNLWLGSMFGFSILAASGKWKWLITSRILAFFGSISYGLYIYHRFCFWTYHWIAKRTGFEAKLHWSLWESLWIEMICGTGAAILVAYLSRKYFEEWFLRLKDKLPGQPSVAMPVDVPAATAQALPTSGPGETEKRVFEKFTCE
jgi:peptidoglycan/LPS O-acetylase OafA/YrhL